VRFEEQFSVEAMPEQLWELFLDIPVMARCIPGVDDVEVIDGDNVSAIMTQSVGPVSATFSVRLEITGREPGSRLDFAAVGKTARGAKSYLRTVGSMNLQGEGESTLVTLTADASLGGMLGTVGQKVLAKHSHKITEQLAAAVRKELSGGKDELQDAGIVPARTPVDAPTAEGTLLREQPAPSSAVPVAPSVPERLSAVPTPVVVTAAFVGGWLLHAAVRGRRRGR
jgi:carbon monoxide dehydrogenase subunit G